MRTKPNNLGSQRTSPLPFQKKQHVTGKHLHRALQDEKIEGFLVHMIFPTLGSIETKQDTQKVFLLDGSRERENLEIEFTTKPYTFRHFSDPTPLGWEGEGTVGLVRGGEKVYI